MGGMALSEENIPLFVILGLQHPPQDCFDLFEGRPLVNLRLLDSAQLFDARSVSAELLEWLVQDALSVMALPPGIMDWLRKDRFEYSRQSVSHVLKSLALLCVRFFAGSPCAELCAPLDDSVLQEDRFNKAVLTTVFEQRLTESRGVVEHFQPIWEEWNDAAADMTSATKRAEVAKCMAKAASDALCWRQRLISSLGVWDALCRAMQPMARHEPRLRRLGRLLQELWPKESSTDQLSLADALKEEQEGVDSLVLPIIENIKRDGLLTYKDVLQLLEELVVEFDLGQQLEQRNCRAAKSSNEGEGAAIRNQGLVAPHPSFVLAASGGSRSHRFPRSFQRPGSGRSCAEGRDVLGRQERFHSGELSEATFTWKISHMSKPRLSCVSVSIAGMLCKQGD